MSQAGFWSAPPRAARLRENKGQSLEGEWSVSYSRWQDSLAIQKRGCRFVKVHIFYKCVPHPKDLFVWRSLNLACVWRLPSLTCSSLFSVCCGLILSTGPGLGPTLSPHWSFFCNIILREDRCSSPVLGYHPRDAEVKKMTQTYPDHPWDWP